MAGTVRWGRPRGRPAREKASREVWKARGGGGKKEECGGVYEVMEGDRNTKKALHSFFTKCFCCYFIPF